MSWKIQRRHFLAGTGAAVIGGAAFAQAAEAGPSRIIDTHTHFYDPSRPQGVPWPSKASKELYKTVLLDDFRAVAQPHGVTGTVIVEASPWLEDNAWLLDLAKDDPWVVGVVGNLAIADKEFPARLKRFAKNPLFRGIRVLTRDLPSPDAPDRGIESLKRLADLDLCLDVNGGPPLLPGLLLVAERVPSLRIIINHLPFDEPSDPARQAARRQQLAEAAEHANVFAKVSLVLRKQGDATPTSLEIYRPQLDRLWKTFGKERVIYGSNWPVSNLLAPYADIISVVKQYAVARGQADAEQYFWKNSLAAYKWLER